MREEISNLYFSVTAMTGRVIHEIGKEILGEEKTSSGLSGREEEEEGIFLKFFI